MQTEELTVAEHPIYVGVPMMDETEARSCVTRIKTRIDIARGELLELHDREGWRALGYKNWSECARGEFGMSVATLYRQLEAAEIMRSMGDSQIENLPTSHLQAVKHLAPEQRVEALSQARAATNGKPTAKAVQQAAAELTQPDLPPEYDIIKRRYEKHGHALSAAWDGAVQRFVVRKDGGTGAVLLWPDVLSRLERLESDLPPPPSPAGWDCEVCGVTITDMRRPTPAICATCCIQRQADRAQSYPANASAYDQQEQADIALMRMAHDSIAAGAYAEARTFLGRVQVAIYERDQVARVLVRTEAQRFWTEQNERRARFSPQAMISLPTWDKAMALFGALLEITT